MSMREFVHLHVYSEYSLLDGEISDARRAVQQAVFAVNVKMDKFAHGHGPP